MRLPRFRPRITVRRMMVAVAIVGLLMGVGRWINEMRSRSADYRKRARAFVNMTSHIGKSARAKDGGWVDPYMNENKYIRESWAREVANKYWRLADRP